MTNGIIIFWSIMLGAILGLAIFIVRWIVREFASDVKDAVRTTSAWDRLGRNWERIGVNSDLLMLKRAILDGQKESEASLKKYITEQLSEDKTLGSIVKLDGEMYVIVGISKDVATGEVASADISLRKIGEDK